MMEEFFKAIENHWWTAFFIVIGICWIIRAFKDKNWIMANENSALNKQEGGNHYKGYAIQPVQYAHANHLDFFQGSVIKYVTRFRDKNGKEDLLKARHFIDMLIELEYCGGNETK